jgi:hypothetical protein
MSQCDHDFEYVKHHSGCHQSGAEYKCTKCGTRQTDWFDRDLSAPYAVLHLVDGCPGCQQLQKTFDAANGDFEPENDTNLFGDVDTVPFFTRITDDNDIAEMILELAGEDA